MLNDPIVIVAVARTPMGAFQGELKELRRTRARRGRDPRRSRAREGEARAGRGGDHGLCAPGRSGPGTRPPGGARRRVAARHRLHDDQQDVRFRHEGGDARARSPCRRHQRHHGRRRHGVDDERALPAGEGARRLSHGSSAGARPHVLRRPRGRLRERPSHGHLRRGMRREPTSSAARRRTGLQSPRSSGRRSANKQGWFAWETTPLAIKAGKEERFIESDEQPFKANLEKIPTLKPAFRKDGTVTAANSSSISDGAAAMVLMRRSTAERLGHEYLAAIVAHSTHAQAPALFTTAPVGAIREALREAPAGRPGTSISTRSTRRSPWSRWRR